MHAERNDERPDSKLIVVSNRGPMRWDGEQWTRSSGGLVTALEPVLRRLGGTWISAAEPGSEGPPPSDDYSLEQVELTADMYEAAYLGVANGVLWPVLHGFPTLAATAEASWSDYVRTNRAFARTIARLAEGNERVWIHDYHLMLVPTLLREMGLKDLRVGWFNHVPWPQVEALATLPWRKQLVHGLLGADWLGFHTAAYAANFLDCAEAFADVSVDRKHGIIESDCGTTGVVACPVGIPVDEVFERVSSEAVRVSQAALRRSVGGRRILLGIDRLDYTKGIPERLAAYHRLLETTPGLIDEVVLVQVVVPSREEVPAYARLKREIDEAVGQLNGLFGRTGRAAVHYRYGSLEPTELYGHYLAADVALVTALRDGMNLVAQEYVASHNDLSGALVLSEFTGAADYLCDAYLVNPYDRDSLAHAIDRALHDTEAERRRRMRALSSAVKWLDVRRFSRSFTALLVQRPTSLRPPTLFSVPAIDAESDPETLSS